MIDVKNLSKSYGSTLALNRVSFHVSAGEVIGLLGPNGAGKTTAMKILTGFLQPDEGEASVDGLDVVANPLEVQTRIGYLPENAPLYPELSVQCYLKMIADLRQIPPAEQPARLSEAVRAAALEDHLTRPIGQLSKGYRQRVGLAQAIVHRPKLLILDEPTVGLDPTQIVEVRRLIRRLAHDATVLLSTHILSEVEASCDRVIILMNGEVKADARLADLSSTTDAVLVLKEGVSGAVTALTGLPKVKSVDSSAGARRHGVSRPRRRRRRPALGDLRPGAPEEWPLRELRRDTRTLENVFNELATAASHSRQRRREGPKHESFMETGDGHRPQGAGRLFRLAHGPHLRGRVPHRHPVRLLLGRNLLRPRHGRRAPAVQVDADPADFPGGGADDAPVERGAARRHARSAADAARRRAQLVLGKFLAVMALVVLALTLTLFLPITVTLLGNLDWGPVLGGYLAALLMAAAYTAIGLFVSSRTDNQIVSLF